MSNLVGRVYDRILDEICDGTLQANTRLVQDDLAAVYGVSRQPVQQAMALLRDRGFVTDAPKRGVIVAEIDLAQVRSAYEVREVLDGLSCRLAAERSGTRARQRGQAILVRGRAAIAEGSISHLIAEDIAFHRFITELSGNVAIAEPTRPHWHHMRRIMGEVLRVERTVSVDIWNEHADILTAIVAGNADRAEQLGRAHISRAAARFVTKLDAMRLSTQAARLERTDGRRLR